MNVKSFALAGAGSLVLAGAVTAGFTGIELVEGFVGVGWAANGFNNTGLTAYRLYANFDGLGDDGVLAVFGQPGDPISVHTNGGTFHNALAFAGDTAPTDLTIIGIWDNQWDTYVTVGATSDSGDATTTSPGFNTITSGLSVDWSDDNAGWFVTPVDAQSVGTHVLIGQFVTDGGLEDLDGMLNILTRENETIKGLPIVPAPGVLALLGLAGVTARRRRR